MRNKTTRSRGLIQDDINNINHRVSRGRSRSQTKDGPMTEQIVESAEIESSGQEEAARRHGPPGTHCTSPAVNPEAVIAPRRQVSSQGRPLGKLPEDQEVRKEPLKLCQFYMRTGTCGYGYGCRHIHPPNVSPPQLSAAGYPLREGVERCRFYIRNGFCGYGATCRFDHPMPPPQRTSQRMRPHAFGPTLNGGALFSEQLYLPTSSWFGPMLPPLSYPAFVARQQSFPFTVGYHQFPYEYPPLPMPMTEGWAQERYMVGSPPSGLPGPTNSDETYVFDEDVSKFESEDDSDASGHIDRCWSN